MLGDIDGLSGITNIGSWPGIKIVDHTSLKNLSGLSTLTWVAGNLTIISNTSLSDLDGLSMFTGAGNDLDIRGNDSLTNMNGLSALNSVGGSFYVQLIAAIQAQLSTTYQQSTDREVYLYSELPMKTLCYVKHSTQTKTQTRWIQILLGRTVIQAPNLQQECKL